MIDVVAKHRNALGPLWLIAVLLVVASCAGSTSLAPTPPSATPSATRPGVLPGSDSLAPKSWPGQYLSFESLSLEQGLSQSTVFCMLQDTLGFMWFGTEDGLNRYDGYSFSVYRHAPDDSNSLSDSWIVAMIEDAAGLLWIGTDEGGLVRYDPVLQEFAHYRNDPGDPSSLSDDRVTALHLDGNGVLWVGTGGGEINRFDQGSSRFTRYGASPGGLDRQSTHAVTSIGEDQNGALWIGTDGGGLQRFEPDDERWWHYGSDPADASSLSHNTVSAVAVTRAGAIWVGTRGGGLDRFDPGSERFTRYRHDPNDPKSLSSDDISAIHEDRDGVLWVGTRGEGLNRFVAEGGDFDRYQSALGDPRRLGSNVVASIFEDREGVLWVGTIGGGVSKLGLGRRNFAHYVHASGSENGPGDNMIRAFHQDQDGDVWVGTMSGGIDKYDPGSGAWRHYLHDASNPNSLSSNWVSDIVGDRSGEVWIGTASGLDRWRPETDTFAHYLPVPDAPPGSPENNVRAIYEDGEGVFWVGTKGGLYQLDPDHDSWDQAYLRDLAGSLSLSTEWILGFGEDRDGHFWIGTWDKGLYGLDRETGTLVHYQHDPGDPQSLGDNLVTAILQDQEGSLWIGGQAGLDRFDPTKGTFTHFGEESGLPNSAVYCIEEGQQGYLWLSTNKGLSRLAPQSLTFTNFDVTDGLQSNEFNGSACLKLRDGVIYFGGINGFNVFIPDRVQDNPVIPPIVLTSLSKDREKVDQEMATACMTEVRFEWPDNAFGFEFAALSFANPQRNQYAYYLEGFEDSWNEVGTRRYGQYTNLPGGNYTLRLKGSSSDGIWNEAGTAIRVTVVPPYWATWWFRGIMVLVVVVGGYGSYRLRVRRLDARGQQLEGQVRARTKELAALNAVASVVSRSLNLQEILSSALGKTLEVIGTEAGGIYLLQQSTQILAIAAQRGLGAEFVTDIDNLKVGEGFSGQVVETGRPLVVHDVSTDSRLSRAVARESGFHALGIVPLFARSEVLGTLFVTTRGRRGFSPDEIELLAAIGSQIGVAVENSRLYEQAQEVAVVQERQRLARELHDSVTQSLHSSALMAEAGQRLAGLGDLQRTQHYLTRLGEISQQALREMRLMVYELRPLALTQIGLVSALQQRLDAVEKRAGVDARLVVDRGGSRGRQEIDIPTGVEEAFYGIAQEALNNALKHANPSQITVTLRIGSRMELEVADDGRGFDVDSVGGAGGIGLVGMRERAEKVRGNLTIHSTAAEGTRIGIVID